jgi:hypothetical protein
MDKPRTELIEQICIEAFCKWPFNSSPSVIYFQNPLTLIWLQLVNLPEQETAKEYLKSN